MKEKGKFASQKLISLFNQQIDKKLKTEIAIAMITTDTEVDKAMNFLLENIEISNSDDEKQRLAQGLGKIISTKTAQWQKILDVYEEIIKKDFALSKKFLDSFNDNLWNLYISHKKIGKPLESIKKSDLKFLAKAKHKNYNDTIAYIYLYQNNSDKAKEFANEAFEETVIDIESQISNK